MRPRPAQPGATERLPRRASNPAPTAVETSVLLRSDDEPAGPLAPVGTSAVQQWTDPDAPPTYRPNHVWFYRVAVQDECGNFTDR